MKLWEYKFIEFFYYKILRIQYYKNYRRFYRIDIRNEMEKEYSFIWFKEMKVGNKTHFTKPFRTKVKAYSLEEAKEKATEFALGKMKLVIVEEKDFEKTDLSWVDRTFEHANRQMEEIMKKLKDL